MENYTIMENARKHVSGTGLRKALEIQSYARQFMGTFLRKRGFLEVPPVIISPITDPLNHPHFDPVIDYYGVKYSLTKSMIFHKQIMVRDLGAIFAFSPNIRLETSDKEATGRHLSEFTQIDLEKKGGSRDEMMSLAEDLITEMFEAVNRDCRSELDHFGRSLKVPSRPFKQISFADAEAQYGKDFETKLSASMQDPFWIIDIPLASREFYDREDPERPGTLLDMDLMYPEGFGEALSGGEREYEIEKIRERIRRKNQTEEQFRWFLEYAAQGLEPSAGFGIGIERLTRFICGLKRIEEVHPFPKVPGKLSL